MFISFLDQWERAKVRTTLTTESSTFRRTFTTDHEDYCFHNESQTLIKRGESAALKEPCEEAACGRDYTISVYG